MDNIVVIETAYDMNNRINTADVTKKLVPETFSLAGSLNKAGDVDKFNSSWLRFWGLTITDNCSIRRSGT